MIRRSLIAIACGSTLAAFPVFSQERDSQSDTFVDAGRGFDATIEIAEEESSAAFKLSGWMVKPPPDAGQRVDLTWSVGAEYPIGGADNILDDATLDRLAGGPKLSIAINALMFETGSLRPDIPEFIRIMGQAREACIEKQRDAMRNGTLTEAAGQKELAYCATADPDPDFVRENLPSARLQMNRALNSGYWSFGLKGSIGSDKYDFVTPGSLTSGDQRLTAYSATLGIGYYLPDAVTAIKFAAEYSSGVEDLDKQVVCKTVIVTPADDCKFALPRAPGREDSLVLRGEIRRFFPFSNGKGGIGTALTGSVDTLSGDFGIELPIYLSLPGDTPILPGITFKYNSDDDDLSVGLFLRTVFKF